MGDFYYKEDAVALLQQCCRETACFCLDVRANQRRSSRQVSNKSGVKTVSGCATDVTVRCIPETKTISLGFSMADNVLESCVNGLLSLLNVVLIQEYTALFNSPASPLVFNGRGVGFVSPLSKICVVRDAEGAYKFKLWNFKDEQSSVLTAYLQDFVSLCGIIGFRCSVLRRNPQIFDVSIFLFRRG